MAKIHAGASFWFRRIEVDVADVLAQAAREGFLTEDASLKGTDHTQVARWSLPSPPESCVDLGSGGGLPAFVLADLWPDSHWVLTEQRSTRASFLRWAIAALGWSDRVSVLDGDVGADKFASWQGRTVDVVTARSFGPRAVVVEVASNILSVGGMMLVSERRDGPKWPADAVALMGFDLLRQTSTSSGTWRTLRFSGDSESLPRSLKAMRRSPRFDDDVE